MSKEFHRTITRKRFATVVLTGVAAAIPVMAMAAPTPVPGTGHIARAGAVVQELSDPSPPNLWTPNGCANRNCHHWGQDNQGCNGNANHAGCGNSGSPNRNGGTGGGPAIMNAVAVL